MRLEVPDVLLETPEVLRETPPVLLETEPVELVPEDVLRTAVAGLEALPEFLDEAAPAVPLPAAAEAVLLVTELMLRVPELTFLEMPVADVLLTAPAAAALLTELEDDVRTADDPLTPETDERELEASPLPVPLEPWCTGAPPCPNAGPSNRWSGR